MRPSPVSERDMGSVPAARLRLYTRLRIVQENFPSLNAPRAKVSDHDSG